MEEIKILTEFLKVIIDWPPIVGVVSLVFLCKFKTEISGFINRISFMKAGAAELSAPQIQERQSKAEENKDLKTDQQIKDFIKEKPDLVLSEYRRVLNSYIFERAFNSIYGTQMRLLMHLIDKREEGDKYVNLIVYYNDFLRISKLQNVQMADYLQYLLSFNFIEYVGQGNDLSVKITPYGVDFFSYIKANYPNSYLIKAY